MQPHAVTGRNRYLPLDASLRHTRQKKGGFDVPRTPKPVTAMGWGLVREQFADERLDLVRYR
jgi:hypothetical protein